MEQTPIPKADIEAKIAELPTEEEEATQTETEKTSGKQKLKRLGINRRRDKSTDRSIIDARPDFHIRCSNIDIVF